MIYLEFHGSAEGQMDMKKDSYMMSMAEYEARIKEVRRDKGVSAALMVLGVMAVLVVLIFASLTGNLMSHLVWAVLVPGLSVIVGGAALLVHSRWKERELERWKTWEMETQAKMRAASGHDLE
ncbi:MAG: hypothetical protein ACE5KV_02335 [Thermoplasmata archaeon]